MKLLHACLRWAALGLSVSAHAFSIPTIKGDWTPAGAPTVDAKIWPVKTSLVLEPATGEFYLFKPHHDEKAKKDTTRVYFSTQKRDFGLDDSFAEALHMVAEFGAVVTRVEKQGESWKLISNGPLGDQAARIEWEALTPPTPAPRGIGKLRVALYDDSGSAGKGIPNCSAQLAIEPDIEVVKLNADGIRAGLSGYHVVIFTGGSGGRQASTIGLSGRERVRQFVEAGGGYVGICAGAYLACDGFKWSVHVLDAKTPSSLWERGHAELVVDATTQGQTVLGMPAQSKILYHNGPILTPASNPSIPDFEPLAFFRTEVSKSKKQQGLQINTPAMVGGTFGKGKVVVSSPHPEQTPGFEHWIEKAVRAVAP